MAGIDDTLDFIQLNIAVLTLSDSRTLETDTSGQILIDRLTQAGHSLADRALIPDEPPRLRDQVNLWAANPNIDAIITTGGTGLTGRDITPETLRPLFDKEIEGFSVVFHMKSYGTVGLSTLQSRACAGLIGRTVVFCLPGSNGAVKDGWDLVIRDQLDSRHRPCNLVELMPRFGESR